MNFSPGLWERRMPPCPFALPPLTCVLSLSVDSSVRPLPTCLPPEAPVRGLSARTGPTVWTRAAGPCASASLASAALSVRSCSVSTSWIVTLTCSSPICRTGRGLTSHCRCVPRVPGHRGESGSRGPWSQARASGHTPVQENWEGPVLVKALWMWPQDLSWD